MKINMKLKDKNPHYIVKMCGDYNDADYSYSEETIDTLGFNEVAELLYDMKKLVGVSHGGDDYDMVEDAIHDLFTKHEIEVDYPYGDTASGDCGIHTLHSLDIQFIDDDGKIYDVELEG